MTLDPKTLHFHCPSLWIQFEAHYDTQTETITKTARKHFFLRIWISNIQFVTSNYVFIVVDWNNNNDKSEQTRIGWSRRLRWTSPQWQPASPQSRNSEGASGQKLVDHVHDDSAVYGEKKSSFFLLRAATKRNQREVGEFPNNFKSVYVYHLAKAGLRQAGPRMGLSGQDSVGVGINKNVTDIFFIIHGGSQ